MKSFTLLLLGSLLAVVSETTVASAEVSDKANVVIIVSDDQRWDKITPEYMPNVYQYFVQNGIAFHNSFVPNPLCCPSRTSILTGNYSHTTGVWGNERPAYGGFQAFDDKHTIAVDFQQAGYRTAMIGKYLNGYFSGENTYVPPGWDTWFAVRGALFYDYGVTATKGKLLYYGNSKNDYISRVLSKRAIRFVTNPNARKPFFLYYAFTAPHTPATPDPHDLTRFAGETGSSTHDNMLASAFSMDREIGKLLAILPKNTIVVFMSDNGEFWGESKGTQGSLRGKQWPYNEGIRVPIYITWLDGVLTPSAAIDDIVLNVDLRTTLTHAVGIRPITRTEGIDWFSPDYQKRSVFPVEHLNTNPPPPGKPVPTYCGARELDFMYFRYKQNDSYIEEFYNDPSETVNLIGDPLYQADYERLKGEAMALCNPTPPGYSW